MSIYIYGDGLDALILAYALTLENRPFKWTVSSDRIGGYFRGGKNCLGEPVDIGMVLFEPNSYEVETKPLESYAGEFGFLARPFLNETYEIISEYLGDSSTVEIQSSDTKGNLTPDYFISDQLTTFRQSPEAIKVELAKSIEFLQSNPSLHPKNKNVNRVEFESIGITDYLKQIYGNLFFEKYFQSYIHCLLGNESSELSAYSHRRAWLPLYWPETILEFLKLEQSCEILYQPIFTKPNLGSTAYWINQMLKTVLEQAVGNVVMIKDYKDAISNLSSKNQNFLFLDERTFSPKQKEESANKIQKVVHLSIVNFCADTHSNKVVFLNQSHNDCFRYSVSAPGKLSQGSITFEFGQSAFGKQDDVIISTARDLAESFGFVPKCEGTLFKGKLPLGSNPEFKYEMEDSPMFSKFLSNSPSKMSMNDNLVRAAYALIVSRKG